MVDIAGAGSQGTLLKQIFRFPCLTDLIRKETDNGRMPGAVFIHLLKAFDRVNRLANQIQASNKFVTLNVEARTT